MATRKNSPQEPQEPQQPAAPRKPSLARLQKNYKDRQARKEQDDKDRQARLEQDDADFDWQDFEEDGESSEEAPAPVPTQEPVVPPPAPRPAPQPRRQDSGGWSLNWKWIGIAVLVFIAAYWFFNQGNTPTSTSNNGGNTVMETEEAATGGSDVVCATIAGLRPNRQFWLDVSQVSLQYLSFQQEPAVGSAALHGARVTASDVLTATGETACDGEDNLWVEAHMIFSGNTVLTGWVLAADGNSSWIVWGNEAPEPATTEEASASTSDGQQSMRSIRVGSGTCVPQLQTADFYNADARNSLGEDMNPDWSGFWVRSSQNRRDDNVNVRASASLSAEVIAQFGFDDQGRAESVEVISYSDGFHYSCANGLVWWNIRWRHVSGTVLEGWVAETDGTTNNNQMIEGFRL